MKLVETWRSLVENIPDIIMVADRDGTIQFINHTVSGMTPEQVIGKKLYDYISAEHHEIMRRYLEQVFQTGVGNSYELIGSGPHGTTSWYWSCVGPIKHQGQVVAASIITRDITERKKAEEALEESEQRFRNIFDNAADGIVLTDVESKKFYIGNKVFCQMLGYSPEEIKTIGVTNVHPAEDLLYVIDQFEGQARGEFTLAKDIPVKRKDGSIFYADINSLPVTLAGKKYLMGIFRDITERKQTEDKLRQYQFMVESAHDAIFFKDLKSRYIIANNKALEAFGLPRDQVIGKNDYEIMADKTEAGKNIEDDRNVLETGKPTEVTKCMTSADGKQRWFQAVKVPQFDDKGNIVGLIGIARDITERKQAEEALRESQRWQIAILDSIPDMAWLKDKESKYVAANETLCQAFGIKLEDFIGKTDFDISPEDLAKRYQADDQKVIKTGERLRIEEPWATKEDTGERIYIETLKTPIRNEKGEIIGTSGIARDITERKKAEEALRRSEVKYKTLLENLPQKIFLKDKNSVYMSCSENYARDMKIKAEEIAGKTDYDFYPKELAEKYRADDKKIIESGETKDIEETYIQDGQERIVHTVKTPVRDEQGNVIGILGIFWDITKIKRTEEELDMYREQMTRAERLASLGTLSATVAHELTQPLTVISLAIENSLAELKKMSCPDSVMEDLKKGLSEISNANSIVNRFRNFARESPDKSVRKVDLKAVADRITDLLEESARRAKVTLQVKGMGKLPPIYSNEKELEQLFFALVDNAIQSADGKKNHRLIITGHLRDDHYIELRFSDNCGGIAPENIDRIFEPFFTTRPQGKGTGLGLCIVQRIASRAGGKVRVESKVGEGSTFLVTLPINPH